MSSRAGAGVTFLETGAGVKKVTPINSGLMIVADVGPHPQYRS